jgi:iron complex outermembrane receptor protein
MRGRCHNKETAMKDPFKLSLLALAFSNIAYAEEVPTYIGDDIVVTATRFPAPADATASNVTIVTAKDIEASGARSVQELLSHQAGINARSVDGTPDMSLDMRGFGKTGDQNVVILLDGQRLNENEDTPTKLSFIPLDNIERIEIMRGSGAVLFGAGASGGVINIITKSAAATPGGSVALGIGSYSGREGRVSWNGRGDHTSLRLAAAQLETDNYRKNNADRQRSLMGDLRHDFTAGTAFVKFGAEDQSLRFPSERVVSPTQGIDELSTDRRGTSSPDDYSKRDSAFVTTGLSVLAGAGSLAVEAGYRNKNQEANFVRFGSYLKGDGNTTSVGVRYRLPYRSAAAVHTLIVGADYADWDYHSLRANDPVSAPIADVAATQRNQSVYFLHLSTFGATTLSLGAREERVEQQARDKLSSESYAQGNVANRVRAYEFGIKQGVAQGLSVSAKLGRSYRLPVVDEIYSQWGGPVYDSIVIPLKPQRSLDGEIGIDYRRGTSHLRASAYRMEVRDELHYNALTYENMNLSPTLHQGVELEGETRVSASLSVFANYTYAQARFVSGSYGGTDVAGKNIPLVPRHRVNLGGTWRVDEQDSVSANLSHVGRQVFDNDQDNTFGQEIPSYTTVDAKFIRESGPWKWTFAVNNLTNEKYYTYGIRSRTTPGRYNAYPMPERNFNLGAEYRF